MCDGFFYIFITEECLNFVLLFSLLGFWGGYSVFVCRHSLLISFMTSDFIDTIVGLSKWLHVVEKWCLLPKFPQIHLIVSGFNDNMNRQGIRGPAECMEACPSLRLLCAFLFHPQINWHGHGIPKGPDWRPKQISAIQTHLPAEWKGSRDWGEHLLSYWMALNWDK